MIASFFIRFLSYILLRRFLKLFSSTVMCQSLSIWQGQIVNRNASKLVLEQMVFGFLHVINVSAHGT